MINKIVSMFSDTSQQTMPDNIKSRLKSIGYEKNTMESAFDKI